MATVELMSVRRTVLPTSPRTGRTKRVAMTIRPETGGTSLNIPYAPQEVAHTNLVADYTTVPRPGLIENVVYTNLQRPRMQMDLEVYDKKVTATTGGTVTKLRALSVIQALQNMARKGTRVRIAYGALESGLWHIISMSVRTKQRDPITDETTGASVSLELIRGDSAISGTGTGPVSGGATTTAPKPTSPSTSSPGKTSTRIHVVRSGESIYNISIKYYGTTKKWKQILDANRLLDPRSVKAGMKLRIP